VSRVLIAVLAGAGLAALAAPAVLRPSPWLLWNASASAPIGLYRVRPGGAPAVSDWVAARPPAEFASLFAKRHYLPLGVPLVKQVAALSPSRICRTGPRITIDGLTRARARIADRLGRPLPLWRGCRRLTGDEVFLLNAAPDSLDGRYFGPTAVQTLIGRLTPVWTSSKAPQ
jgi:type IV secretory pathway protease TraF